MTFCSEDRHCVQAGPPRPAANVGEACPPAVLLHTGNFGAPSEVWVYRHAIGLKRYRCRVATQEYLNRDEFPFPCVRHFDHPSRLVHRLMQLECGLRTLRWPRTPDLQAWRLRQSVRKTRARLIHTHFLWNGPLAARVAEERGIPLIVTAHGSDTNRARVNEHYRESLQPVFRTAARIVAVSDFIAARLVEIGCPRDNIVRMYLGAPLPGQCATAGEQGERIDVICVAALRAVKGHRYLLDAFARASSQEPRLFLTLAGEGELRQEIESQVRGLGVTDKVLLTGWVAPPRVADLLSGSHIYAQHSIAVGEERAGKGPSMGEEGLGLSLVEAAASGVALAEPCRRLAIPFIVHFHGYDAYNKFTLRSYGESYRRMFDSAAALIAVSQDMVGRLTELGAPRDKVFLNPCGVDTAVFSPGDPGDSPPRFAAVASFRDKKAPHLTLIAFSRLRESCPDATIVFVGDGPLLESCKQLATSLHLQDAVQFLGQRSYTEVAGILKSARAFVQHSVRAGYGDSEGTPVAILEAGACALPVVATRHAGIKDAVLHGTTGFLVEELDIGAMAQHMIALAKNPELAARLGAAARQRIVDNYSMDKSIGRLWEIIARCMEERGRVKT